MALAWIALGSNLDDPPAQLRLALNHLQQSPGLTLEARSGFYRSEPIGPPGQDVYCNAVCRVRTRVQPDSLLQTLQDIETRMGRDRSAARWAARVIDLDLLLYDGLVLHSPALILPHPELHRRNFVLAPLCELDPALEVPGQGRVDALTQAIGNRGLGAWKA